MERADKLDATDADGGVAPALPGGAMSDDRDGQGIPPLVKVGIVFAMLAGALSLLWFSTTAEDAFVYSKLVHEVMAEPGSFRDRPVRVEGDLKQGSIVFREQPCEWRFTLSDKGKEMPVRFPQCVVPDTFKDGMGLKVTVQGRLSEQGHFAADQVIPRCPSKYEMQQAQQRGEKMPHAMPTPGGPLPGS